MFPATCIQSAFLCNLLNKKYVSKSVTGPAQPSRLAARLEKLVLHNFKKIIMITNMVYFNIATDYFILRQFFKETAFAFLFVEDELVQ